VLNITSPTLTFGPNDSDAPKLITLARLDGSRASFAVPSRDGGWLNQSVLEQHGDEAVAAEPSRERASRERAQVVLPRARTEQVERLRLDYRRRSD
jgi:hypothetical protein